MIPLTGSGLDDAHVSDITTIIARSELVLSIVAGLMLLIIKLKFNSW